MKYKEATKNKLLMKRNLFNNSEIKPKVKGKERLDKTNINNNNTYIG
jgi:hypothetical protein